MDSTHLPLTSIHTLYIAYAYLQQIRISMNKINVKTMLILTKVKYVNNKALENRLMMGKQRHRSCWILPVVAHL